MSLQQTIIKGVAWSAVQNWGRRGISFLVFTLLVRLLEPETFGLVALASIFFSFLEIMLEQGFVAAVIQRRELTPAYLDTAFWINLAIGIVLTGLAVAVAGPVAHAFGQPRLIPIICWLSMELLFGALSHIQIAILQRDFAFRSLAIRSLVATLAGGIVGVSMALKGAGVWSLVAQQLVGRLVEVFVLWSASSWRPRFNISLSLSKELFGFGMYVTGNRVLTFLNRRLDQLLIGYYLGPTVLGYYFIANRVLMIMTELLTSSMGSVALPTFSRLQQDKERLRRAFYTATQLTSLVAFPAFFLVFLMSPEIVRVLFGEQWSPSIPVIQIFTFMGILYAIFYFNQPIVTAAGKPSWNLALTFINVLANVAALIVVLRWGIVAVAAAYVIRAYLLSPLSLFLVYKLIHFNVVTYFRQYVAAFLSSLFLGLFVIIIKKCSGNSINQQALLAICTIVGMMVYISSISIAEPAILQKAFNLVRHLKNSVPVL